MSWRRTHKSEENEEEKKLNLIKIQNIVDKVIEILYSSG